MSLLFVLVVISLDFSIHISIGLLVVVLLLSERFHELASLLSSLSHTCIVFNDELSLLLHLLLADLLLRQQNLPITGENQNHLLGRRILAGPAATALMETGDQLRLSVLHVGDLVQSTEAARTSHDNLIHIAYPSFKAEV